MRLHAPNPIESGPLTQESRPDPGPGEGELLLKVRVCGICHTDLHTVEGDIQAPALPVTPGHQVVAEVAGMGTGVTGWQVGDLAGVPWLYRSCGKCVHCTSGEENLCEQAEFTGFHRDGGYAEFMLADPRYTLHLPTDISEAQLAPLLCAGIIGYRSLRKSDLQAGERLGLIGFGASAHLVIQVARYWGNPVFVFTRSRGHQELAADLGAEWVGGPGDKPPVELDRVVIFAPAGELVPTALSNTRPGCTVAINAIHMSPIPEMEYELLYGERTLRSVANATVKDGEELLELAAAIPIRSTVQLYDLERANQALEDLKHSRIDGAGVLQL